MTKDEQLTYSESDMLLEYNDLLYKEIIYLLNVIRKDIKRINETLARINGDLDHESNYRYSVNEI